MAISFSCENCKKKINAPDEAGGKWGKCPHCQHRCYIPMPESEYEEELKLTPLDESEETRRNEMMQETFSVTREILHEKDPDGAGDEPAVVSQISDSVLAKDIRTYLRQMADGELEKAHKLEAKLVKSGRQALEVLDEIADAPGAELVDIAPGLLSGLIRKFRTKLR